MRDELLTWMFPSSYLALATPGLMASMLGASGRVPPARPMSALVAPSTGSVSSTLQSLQCGSSPKSLRRILQIRLQATTVVVRGVKEDRQRLIAWLYSY